MACFYNCQFFGVHLPERFTPGAIERDIHASSDEVEK
jgi:hypothetical protein